MTNHQTKERECILFPFRLLNTSRKEMRPMQIFGYFILVEGKWLYVSYEEFKKYDGLKEAYVV